MQSKQNPATTGTAIFNATVPWPVDCLGVGVNTLKLVVGEAIREVDGTGFGVDVTAAEGRGEVLVVALIVAVR